MLAANPTLNDFQERFDKIVAEYNKEKDKNTIEATFEALMRMAADLEEEAQSHVALGLTEEQKPVFDLLMREDLSKEEIRQIKSVSVEILKQSSGTWRRCRICSQSRLPAMVFAKRSTICSTMIAQVFRHQNMTMRTWPTKLTRSSNTSCTVLTTGRRCLPLLPIETDVHSPSFPLPKLMSLEAIAETW